MARAIGPAGGVLADGALDRSLRSDVVVFVVLHRVTSTTSIEQARCHARTPLALLTAEVVMAKYGKAAGKRVKSAMHRRKKGTLKSGKGGKGGTVKSRKQAIAIGLSEAREKGKKVPAKRKSRSKSKKK